MLPLAKFLQLILIACTGISTFYVAAHWAGARRDGSGARADVVVPVAASRAAAATPSATVVGALAPDADPFVKAAERLRSIPRSDGDPFASLNWLPPPPPPPPAKPAPAPPPPKPAAPTAPPLPFVFIGMLERDTEKTKAFLAKGEALFVVSVGDTLDDSTYRVESLTASEVVMTYLPLNTQQTLNVSTGSK